MSKTNIINMTSSDVRLNFGNVTDNVLKGKTILVVRHHKPVGVFISHDRYKELENIEDIYLLLKSSQ